MRATLPNYSPNLQAYRTAETAVARLRLDTPGDMGMETQWAALAINSRLSPSRSAPKAKMALDGNNPCRNGSPPGAITTKGR